MFLLITECQVVGEIGPAVGGVVRGAAPVDDAEQATITVGTSPDRTYDALRPERRASLRGTRWSAGGQAGVAVMAASRSSTGAVANPTRASLAPYGSQSVPAWIRAPQE